MIGKQCVSLMPCGNIVLEIKKTETLLHLHNSRPQFFSTTSLVRPELFLDPRAVSIDLTTDDSYRHIVVMFHEREYKSNGQQKVRAPKRGESKAVHCI